MCYVTININNLKLSNSVRWLQISIYDDIAGLVVNYGISNTIVLEIP